MFLECRPNNCLSLFGDKWNEWGPWSDWQPCSLLATNALKRPARFRKCENNGERNRCKTTSGLENIDLKIGFYEFKEKECAEGIELKEELI